MVQPSCITSSVVDYHVGTTFFYYFLFRSCNIVKILLVTIVCYPCVVKKKKKNLSKVPTLETSPKYYCISLEKKKKQTNKQKTQTFNIPFHMETCQNPTHISFLKCKVY